MQIYMPVHSRKDSKGPYFQWGNHGKKYYYKSNSERSKETARKKAARQGRAIKAQEAMHGGNTFDYYSQYLKYKQMYQQLTQ